jgi:serine/threonine protein kinase
MTTSGGDPETLGEYRILRRLGEGGMGTVYLAEDAEGRKFALKAPASNVSVDPTHVKRIFREALAAAQIDHPNIGRILDVRQEGTRYYLVMSYIEGKTLAEWLEQGRSLSIDESVALVASLCRTVQVAHDAGIIHRDLKPANVMIRDGSEPIVMDFGMARRFDGGESLLTPSGAIVGTPGYMAPEQITGGASDIGPACDLYGLGVMLYELVTGWQPFTGNLATLLGSIVSDAPTPPRKHCPDLDPSLERICMKCLEKDPGQRYGSTKELADVLDKWLSGDRSSPPPPPTQVAPPPASPSLLGRLWSSITKQK